MFFWVEHYGLCVAQESDDDEYDDAEDLARKAKKRAEKAAKEEEQRLGKLEIPDDELHVNLR